MVKTIFASIIFLLGNIFYFSPAHATPTVVVSIKPLHSLVANIMEGVGTPVLLLEDTTELQADFLPSHVIEKLEAADIIFYIGTPLEGELVSSGVFPIKKLNAIALAEEKNLLRLPPRNLFLSSIPENSATYDPHIWLSTPNAITMVRIIANRLSALDPQHTATYTANAATTITRLEKLHEELDKQLRYYRNVRYVVSRDEYHYFEQEFGLQPIAAVNSSSDVRAAPTHINALHDLIIQKGASCLFATPYANTPSLIFLSEQTNTNMGLLDAIGVNVPEGKDAYFTVMKDIANNMVKCFVDLSR